MNIVVSIILALVITASPFLMVYVIKWLFDIFDK